MTRRRRDRQLWLVPTVGLFVLAPIGAAVYSAVTSTREPSDDWPSVSRKGSEDLGRESTALKIGEEPLSYRVVYDVERYGVDGIHRSRDRIEVRRPFEGRVEDARAGAKPQPRISRIGTLVLSTGAGARTLVSPPAPATGDLRLKPVLADAVAAGHLELRERRRVLDRECQVYRAGSSVSAGGLTPVGAKPGEHSDFCVDEDGMLLEEVWEKDGRPLQRRIARRLDLGVTFPADHFEIAGEIQVPFEEGNGFLRRLAPDSGFEGTLYHLEQPPEGFEHLGRYLIQPPKLDPFQNRLDEDRPRGQVGIADVWERGPDLLVMTQLIAADISAVPQNSPTARPVELPLGRASSILDLRANEVRIELPEDRFLRLSGTLTRKELVEITGDIRVASGSGLVFLDS